MFPALIIFLSVVIVGVILWALNLRDEKKGRTTIISGPKVTDPPAGNNDEEGACCGLHITCEKDSLLAGVSDTVEYFDDEELDRFAGRDSGSYTPDEEEEFREILLTLLPEDIAPWGRSLQLRGISLPEPVREELLMIVSEYRNVKK